jgi:hypothetical protein
MVVYFIKRADGLYYQHSHDFKRTGEHCFVRKVHARIFCKATCEIYFAWLLDNDVFDLEIEKLHTPDTHKRHHKPLVYKKEHAEASWNLWDIIKQIARADWRERILFKGSEHHVNNSNSTR